MKTKGFYRKQYEIKLSKIIGITATAEQVRRIREGAADLANGADWNEVLAWVKSSEV